MRWGIILIIVLLLAPAVAAEKIGSMKLLAVSDEKGREGGSIADITLEIRDGNGRVFLETFPATKVDTQISTRFAQQIACNYLEADCSDKDFIYTIKAGASIVGGPSAGAAATALTIFLLEDQNFKKDVAVTGTINSGGLVGGVGGIKDKIDAAESDGINKVLIPQGKRLFEEKKENQTIDLVEYGKQKNIEVVEVATVDDMLFHFTGRKPKQKPTEFKIDQRYEDIMRSLAIKLCKRSSSLEEENFDLRKDIPLNESLLKLYNQGIEYSKRSKESLKQGDYYSSASFCFRSNVQFAFMNSLLRNESEEVLAEKVSTLKKAINTFNEELEQKPIISITDLQTDLIVKERLTEAEEYTNQAFKGTSLNYAVTFANERLFSAIAWSEFFKITGSAYNINENALKKSCENKIREAEERFQYVTIYLPDVLQDTRKNIDQAVKYAQEKDYTLCLFTASRAKAEANVVASVLAQKPDVLNEIIETKLGAAKQAISKSQRNGDFPIVGYSYYEYANSLKNTDPQIALLFAEYALELSNLDIYFDTERAQLNINVNWEVIPLFLAGLILGFAIFQIRK